jgi:hypothetical protein
MKTFFISLLSDGQGGLDEQALISIGGACVFFSMIIYTVVVRGAPFDPLAFGTGFGTLLGATSAGFGLRMRLATKSGNVSNLTGAPDAGNPV